jgi:hypothetical protein
MSLQKAKVFADFQSKLQKSESFFAKCSSLGSPRRKASKTIETVLIIYYKNTATYTGRGF